MELLEKDEEYVISLLKQAKKVEAIAFLHKNKYTPYRKKIKINWRSQKNKFI